MRSIELLNNAFSLDWNSYSYPSEDMKHLQANYACLCAILLVWIRCLCWFKIHTNADSLDIGNLWTMKLKNFYLCNVMPVTNSIFGALWYRLPLNIAQTFSKFCAIFSSYKWIFDFMLQTISRPSIPDYSGENFVSFFSENMNNLPTCLRSNSPLENSKIDEPQLQDEMK